MGLDISAANRQQQSRTLSVARVTQRTLPTCFKRTTFIYVAQNASTQEFVSTRHSAAQSRDTLPDRLLTALAVTATRSKQMITQQLAVLPEHHSEKGRLKGKPQFCARYNIDTIFL